MAPSPPPTVVPSLDPSPRNSSLPGSSYDAKGALFYVVTVCCVYALAIMFMIGSNVRRRTAKQEVDAEIAAYLRCQPQIRREEECLHRKKLKRAMQPFIELAINRRTLGVQADIESTGQFSGGKTLTAAYGHPGRSPVFQENLQNEDISLTAGGGASGHHRWPLALSLQMGPNDKALQCQLADWTVSTVAQTHAPPESPREDIQLSLPKRNVFFVPSESHGHSPRHSRVPSPSGTLTIGTTGMSPERVADAEFLCELTQPIMMHFAPSPSTSHRPSLANFFLPRAISVGDPETVTKESHQQRKQLALWTDSSSRHNPSPVEEIEQLISCV